VAARGSGGDRRVPPGRQPSPLYKRGERAPAEGSSKPGAVPVGWGGSGSLAWRAPLSPQRRQRDGRPGLAARRLPQHLVGPRTKGGTGQPSLCHPQPLMAPVPVRSGPPAALVPVGLALSGRCLGEAEPGQARYAGLGAPRRGELRQRGAGRGGSAVPWGRQAAGQSTRVLLWSLLREMSVQICC